MTYQPVGRPPAPAPDRDSIRTNAIILIVAGALCGGMLPMVFGIIALVQVDTDPNSARTMNKIGWITLIVILVLLVLFFVVYIGFFVLVMGFAFLPFLSGG